MKSENIARKDGHSALKSDGKGGFEKFDPHPALPQQEETAPKEREFCEWMIGFNSEPKFVQKFTTLFIEACNERMAKGGYPLHSKPSPAPLPEVELPPLEYTKEDWDKVCAGGTEGGLFKLSPQIVCRERQLLQSQASLTQALTSLVAAKSEIEDLKHDTKVAEDSEDHIKDLHSAAVKRAELAESKLSEALQTIEEMRKSR